MFDAGRQPGLLQKTLAGVAPFGKPRPHYLERHPSAETVIHRLVDQAHAAFAHQGQNAIPAEPADLVARFGRRQRHQVLVGFIGVVDRPADERNRLHGQRRVDGRFGQGDLLRRF